MTTSNKITALFIILGTIYWSFSAMIPSYNSGKEDNNPQEFSVNNALYHLKNITKNEHHVGSDGHKSVQNYLVNELRKLGLTPEIQTKTGLNKKWATGTTAENIIAKIEGTSEGKSLLLLTHYDSNPHSSIGASDAGSGVVTILEGVRAFLAKNKRPKNDIIILLSDAEEGGLLGAKAFVKYHPLAKNVGLVLNFEARGSGGPSYMLMETNGKNSVLISEFLKSNPSYPAANSLMYSVYKMLPNDTDLTVFRENANISGFNFAFIGDHFDYHTAQDTYERADRNSLVHQKEYLMKSLSYFSDANLNNLNSDEDFVYVNFPFIGLLTYSFDLILPLICLAIVILVFLILVGVKKNKLTLTGIIKGMLPFSIALVVCGAITLILWKLILIIHPQYKDMLHGFTYNGYQYIAAFVFLNIWIIFKIYSYFRKETSSNLFIAPILFWLIVNILIFQYLKGASFFIIPVFIALLILATIIFVNSKAKSKPALYAFLSIPSLYIFSPLVKMFPVGLGLKSLVISAILIVLLLGMLIPIFHRRKKKNSWQLLAGLGSILFFGIATFNSGFSVDKKQPNSLVYIQYSDTKTASWASYNNNLDAYTKQVLSTEIENQENEGAETQSKYNSTFKHYSKAPFKNIIPADILIDLDTIIGNNREISFTIQSERKISKYEMLCPNNKTQISLLTLNSEALYDKNALLKKGTVFTYFMGNSNKNLKVSIRFPKEQKTIFILNEISNDLLTNPKFNIKPRSEIMMPMPFVTNDAIICNRTLNF